MWPIRKKTDQTESELAAATVMNRRQFLVGLIATGVAAGVTMPTGLTKEAVETVMAAAPDQGTYIAIMHPRAIFELGGRKSLEGEIGAKVMETVFLPVPETDPAVSAVKRALMNKHRNFKGRAAYVGSEEPEKHLAKSGRLVTSNQHVVFVEDQHVSRREIGLEDS